MDYPKIVYQVPSFAQYLSTLPSTELMVMNEEGATPHETTYKGFRTNVTFRVTNFNDGNNHTTRVYITAEHPPTEIPKWLVDLFDRYEKVADEWRQGKFNPHKVEVVYVFGRIQED